MKESLARQGIIVEAIDIEEKTLEADSRIEIMFWKIYFHIWILYLS